MRQMNGWATSDFNPLLHAALSLSASFLPSPYFKILTRPFFIFLVLQIYALLYGIQIYIYIATQFPSSYKKPIFLLLFLSSQPQVSHLTSVHTPVVSYHCSSPTVNHKVTAETSCSKISLLRKCPTSELLYNRSNLHSVQFAFSAACFSKITGHHWEKKITVCYWVATTMPLSGNYYLLKWISNNLLPQNKQSFWVQIWTSRTLQ